METNFNTDDELIIVNDCSTDDTAAVLNRLKTVYPGIKVITHIRNKGGGAARNTAVEDASNELLFCLDSDNILAVNSITPLKEHLYDTGADIASFQEMRYFNSDDCTDTQYTWKFLPVTSLKDFMADHKNPGSSGNYLFTKKSWINAKGYPDYAGALDTWGFCFNQLVSGSKMVSLSGSFYFHRYGTASYYIRDMNSRNMSIAALQIILPYYKMIHPADLNYIMSKNHRFTWFDHLNTKPIRIIANQSEKNEPTRISAYRRTWHRLKKLFRSK
jgi:glycosyltransferase involved in cell wall biosynthesis